MDRKFTQAVAAYFTHLRRLQASGGATGERYAYGALTGLLNAVVAPRGPRRFDMLSAKVVAFWSVSSKFSAAAPR